MKKVFTKESNKCETKLLFQFTSFLSFGVNGHDGVKSHGVKGHGGIGGVKGHGVKGHGVKDQGSKTMGSTATTPSEFLCMIALCIIKFRG